MGKVNYEGRVIRTAILYPKETLPILLHSLTEYDFSDPLCKRAFVALKELSSKSNVDNRMVYAKLEEDGIDKDMILNYWSSYYYATQLEDPIKQIKSRTQLANLKITLEKALKECELTKTKPDELAVRMMQDLNQVRFDGEDASNIEGVRKLREQWKRTREAGGKGIPTGFSAIDFVTYGMRPQEMWLIGGQTSVGKTWVATKMVNAFLKEGVPVLWVSFEMSREKLLWRTLIQRMEDSTITLDDIEHGSAPQEKQDAFDAALEAFQHEPLYCVDYVHDWDRAMFEILYQIYAHDVKCIVVDYLQNISTNEKSEYDGMNMVVRQLQHLAVEKNVFVVAFSQMNRDSQKTEQFENSGVFGFKGSGNLENAADCALIYQFGDPKNHEDERRKLVLAKNRSGRLATSYVLTDYSYGKIENMKEDMWGVYLTKKQKI
jgi:replicative DNA helicase